MRIARSEGLGIVVIEAQAVGLPCVVSEAVPRAVDIVEGLVSFRSISSVDDWIGAIDSARTIERRDTHDQIAAAGYDIEREIDRLERFFEE